MLERFFSHSDADRPPLRVGVLLNGETLLRPFAEVLRQVRAADFVRLELAVFNAAAAVASPARRSSRLGRALDLLRDKRRRRTLLFEYFERWDRRRHPDAAQLLEGVDCSALLDGIDRLDVVPLARGFTHRFRPKAVAAIQARDLDVLLSFGFNILRGEILRSARYGVWSYHHGDNDSYRGGPAGFWELYEDHPLTGVMLQVLTEELDAGRVLCKARTATEPGVSLVRNRQRPYATGVSMVLQKLWELHRFGWEHVERRMLAPAPYRGRRALYRRPTNVEMSRFLAPRLARKAWRRVTATPALTYHWSLALRREAGRRLDPTAPQDFSGFRWIDPPRGHYYADPCLLTRNGRTWLFFEDYLYHERRGTIACAEVRPDGSISDPARIIDLPHHVSYPFVFEDGGEVFMIPETGRDGTVKLFRASAFPFDWTLEKVLFPGRAVDTTVVRHDGRYWFFTAVADPPEASHCLLLFSAASLTGDWTFHPANPISRDVRTARPAGGLFWHEGRLVRPAQDGSLGYGRAVGFHEILTLNPAEYRERRLATVEPSWQRGLAGTHTYARCDTAEALDGSRLVRRRAVAGAPGAEQEAEARTTSSAPQLVR